MAHNKIVLGEIYYDIHGREFIPVEKKQGNIKRYPFNPWADQDGREAARFTDANGKTIQKGKFYTRERILINFSNQLREIKRNAKKYAFQNRKNQS